MSKEGTGDIKLNEESGKDEEEETEEKEVGTEGDAEEEEEEESDNMQHLDLKYETRNQFFARAFS